MVGSTTGDTQLDPASGVDWEQELARLHREFEAHRDLTVGHELVARHAEHAESLSTTSPSRATLPEPERPAPSATIPETTPDRLTAEVLERALVEHGALIVRGLVPEEHRSRIIDGIDRGLDAQEAFVRRGGELVDPSHFQPFPVPPHVAGVRAWAVENSAVMLADSPTLFYDVLRMLRDTGIIQLARRFLGAEPVMTMTKSAARRIEAGSGICWHQDGGFLGNDNVVLNLWTTLTPCGPGRAPGLELVTRRFQEVVPPRPDAEFAWSVGDSLPDGVDWETQDPVLDAGDAILFDQLLVHRTGRGEGTTGARYGTETWMFGAGSVPEHEFVPLSTSIGAGER